MNSTIKAEELIKLLENAIPCKDCGGKPIIDFIGGLASSIACENKRYFKYYMVNKSIFAHKITDYDSVKSVMDIIKIWNKYNSDSSDEFV